MVILCSKLTTAQKILDPALLLKVSVIQVSADHRRLAYAVDLTGEEQYHLYVKEVDTGEVTQLTKVGTASGSVAWALDNSTLFYVTLVGASFFVPHTIRRGHCRGMCCMHNLMGRWSVLQCSN